MCSLARFEKRSLRAIRNWQLLPSKFDDTDDALTPTRRQRPDATRRDQTRPDATRPEIAAFGRSSATLVQRRLTRTALMSARNRPSLLPVESGKPVLARFAGLPEPLNRACSPGSRTLDR